MNASIPSHQTRGKLIVIEGTDGSGKATQTGMLVEKLRQIGQSVLTMSFPRYNHASSWLIRQYLAGEFGPADAVPPKIASTFFAFDRLDAAGSITTALAQGQHVILDRWVSSNKGHQLGKITGDKERHEFLTWMNEFEYMTNGLPIPDLTILLYLDPLAAVSSSGEKGGVAHDVHESDLDHLRRAADAYLWVARHDTVEHWVTINCVNERHERWTPVQMHQRVWREVSQIIGLSHSNQREEPQNRVEGD